MNIFRRKDIESKKSTQHNRIVVKPYKYEDPNKGLFKMVCCSFEDEACSGCEILYYPDGKIQRHLLKTWISGHYSEFGYLQKNVKKHLSMLQTEYGVTDDEVLLSEVKS